MKGWRQNYFEEEYSAKRSKSQLGRQNQNIKLDQKGLDLIVQLMTIEKPSKTTFLCDPLHTL